MVAKIYAEALAVLPSSVKRRLKALRNLQVEHYKIEAQFGLELHALECKYAELYKPLLEKRAKIVNGEYEPTDEECVNPWLEGKDDELTYIESTSSMTEISGEHPNIVDKPKSDDTGNIAVNGIPDFWLTIFKNVWMLSQMVHERDEPVLKSLEDIKVKMHEDPIGFSLEFHFAPNEYFTDRVLTKEFLMESKLDDKDPLLFEGKQIYSSKGCKINWKDGKNLTGNAENFEAKSTSVFDIFSPPTKPDDPNFDISTNPKLRDALQDDFHFGFYSLSHLVPSAVLLFLGKGLGNDFDDDNKS